MNSKYETASAGPGTESARKSMEGPAREQVRSMKEEAKHKGREYISHYKGTAAGIAADFADALNVAADELEEKDRLTSADYIRSASGEIRRLSSSLDERHLDEFAEQIKSFARRQPAVMFGGAVVAGFALTRLLKGTAQEYEPESSEVSEPEMEGSSRISAETGTHFR